MKTAIFTCEGAIGKPVVQNVQYGHCDMAGSDAY